MFQLEVISDSGNQPLPNFELDDLITLVNSLFNISVFQLLTKFFLQLEREKSTGVVSNEGPEPQEIYQIEEAAQEPLEAIESLEAREPNDAHELQEVGEPQEVRDAQEELSNEEENILLGQVRLFNYLTQRY